MPELLEVLENIRAEEASVQRLYGDAGQRVGRKNNPEYVARLAEVAMLFSDVLRGRRRTWVLQEAMTASDFPQLFGDIIDRQLLANYATVPNTWPAYVHRSTVRDFRTVKRFRVDGGTDILSEVVEQGEYPEAALTDDVYTYAVAKHGREYAFSWEAIINDDLQALEDIPRRMALAAARSEERFATKLFVGSTGPDSTLYSSGNKNIISANPVLSIAGLQTGFTTLQSQLDNDGQPIAVDAVMLVVPPALEVTAQNILNATELWLNDAGGTTNEQVHTVNWMRNRLTLKVDYQLPLVDTTHGSTAWYLFADPNNGRPALEMGFLRGHENPELFMATSNAIRVGGGITDPMDGSFDNDSLRYKVRHTFGGGQMDPRMTAASNGSGS